MVHIMRFPLKKLMKKTHRVQLAGAYLFSSCNVLIHYRIIQALFIYLIMHTHLKALITTGTGSQKQGIRHSNSSSSRSGYPFNLSSISIQSLLSACTNLNLISLPICCMDASSSLEKRLQNVQHKR